MRMRLRSNALNRLVACRKWLITTNDDSQNVLETLKTREIIDFSTLFGNSNPVFLEIGCGQGKFACDFALAHPEYNFLAVEKISNVILSGVEKASELNIDNLRFLRGKAECLQKYILPNSISGIYLNFSTPLPKKGYAKQRLTASRFLNIYSDLLIKNGFISQKTDDEDFFDFSVDEFKNNGFEIVEITRSLHANGKVGIITEYENKFISLGLPIYYLKVVKKD